MLSKFTETAKRMRDLRRIKRQIEAIEAEGEAGGGKVKIRMNGARKVRSVHIEAEVVATGDAKLLENLVKAAANDALRKLEREAAQNLDIGAGDLGALAGGS